MLSDGELDTARDLIRRALQEDLRYGPDVTTQATVPAGAVATASRRSFVSTLLRSTRCTASIAPP